MYDHRANNIVNLNHKINIFFPDCDLGAPHSKNAIRTFWGDNAEIYAHNFKTLQDGGNNNGVAGFLARVNRGESIYDSFQMIEGRLYNPSRPSPLDWLLDRLR